MQKIRLAVLICRALRTPKNKVTKLLPFLEWACLLHKKNKMFGRDQTNDVDICSHRVSCSFSPTSRTYHSRLVYRRPEVKARNASTYVYISFLVTPKHNNPCCPGKNIRKRLNEVSRTTDALKLEVSRTTGALKLELAKVSYVSNSEPLLIYNS